MALRWNPNLENSPTLAHILFPCHRQPDCTSDSTSIFGVGMFVERDIELSDSLPRCLPASLTLFCFPSCRVEPRTCKLEHGSWFFNQPFFWGAPCWIHAGGYYASVVPKGPRGTCLIERFSLRGSRQSTEA
eukprot:s3261_g2.t1